MKLRPHFRRLAVAAAAVASALAMLGLPAVASAATQAAAPSLSSTGYPAAAAQTSTGPYGAIAYSPGTGKYAAGAASAASATSRPPNGTILYSGIRGGMGRLTIKNGPRHDGVVTLMRGRSKAISVYVRARSSATVRNIKPGTYTIYYTTGSLFSVSRGRFTRGATYWRFNNRLRFASPPYYTFWTVTLYAVPGGNASTTQISPGSYPR